MIHGRRTGSTEEAAVMVINSDNAKTVHPAPRQTLSYLQNLFAERGIRPKNKLGQNFLIDLNLVDLLARTAELTADDLAVEIGSGTGSLTARLADHAGAVFTVEIDTAFAALVRENVRDRPHVVVLQADVLKNKNHLNPDVLSAIADLRRRYPCQSIKLVANLPYAVATPVITNFLLSELPFERMIVTVQWEIAERLTAAPDHKEYGALAVLVQSLADVSIVRRLPPSVFWPRPQVASAIVAIRPSAVKRTHVVERVGDVQRFRTFLRDLYTHRRKNLRGGLAGLPSGRLAKDEVDRKLDDLKLDGTIRAEDLDLEQHLRLCAVFG
jgi:16S rRNA (adenine1518-N6/adenine1519-N6)-dimethyltransferase